MTTLVNKKGIAAMLATNLAARFVFAELLDRRISGNVDAISPSEIAGEINIPTSDVLGALEALDEMGLIDISEPWDKVGTFYIGAISLSLKVGQMANHAITRTAETVTSREMSGLDQLQVGPDLVRASVQQATNEDGTGSDRAMLHVVRNPGAEGEFLVMDKEFPDKSEAWFFWDNFKKDFDFEIWLYALPADPHAEAPEGEVDIDVVWLCPSAFAQLTKVIEAQDEHSASLSEKDGFVTWNGRLYKLEDSDNPGAEYCLFSDEELRAADDEAQAFFSDELPLKEFTIELHDGVECKVEWEPAFLVGMDKFSFTPAPGGVIAEGTVWSKNIASERVPKTREDHQSFACDLARKHFEDHYPKGGQAA